MVSVIGSSLLIILAAARMSAKMIDHFKREIDLKRLDVVAKCQGYNYLCMVSSRFIVDLVCCICICASCLNESKLQDLLTLQK